MPDRSRHRSLRLAAALALLAAACSARAEPGLGAGELASYRSLLERLAADSMEGRGVLTDGNRRATELLEREFRAAGLEPGGTGGSYRQCFEHPVTASAGEVWLELDGHALPDAAVAPAVFSASAEFEGDLWFAGYGIHAPEEGYDDYAELDAEGKVLLVLRYEPRERDPESPLNGAEPSRHSDLRRKVFEAKSRGARAVLLVAAPREGEEPDAKVPSLTGAEVESSSGIPVLHLLPAEADARLARAGSSLAEQVAAIDRDLASTPLPLGRARGKAVVEREMRRLCNVVGILPGRGILAEQAVVIGAHFDHLGYGQSGTLEPGVHAIHNGADDNASGAAGLVALARALADDGGGRPRRTIVLVAFNAEEIGLAGSSAFVEDPPIPLEKIDAMLNLDMIGRLREGRLTVLGTDTGDRWNAWIRTEAEARGLELTLYGDGYGPSDQMTFYAKGIPVLHFFTGAHDDYHRPTDDSDRIHYRGAARVLGLVAAVARRAAEEVDRIAYRETAGGPHLVGDSRSYGAWLGTIPDYSAMSPEAGGGVLLSGVRKGGPAEQAGIRGRDRVVSLAGREIDNLYDMTFVLRDHRPGEVIEVSVERESERITFAVTLGTREEMGAPSPSGASPHREPAGGAPHGGGEQAELSPPAMDPGTLLYPGEERHLRHLRQLTREGENAEAYWSPDGKRLVFQARGEGVPCDRIYTLELQSGAVEPVSSGEGRTTCAYFTWPDGEGILYASTHLAGRECPPPPDRSRGYVWPLYGSYDLFLKRPGAGPIRLTETPGYDAEATACFRDGRVVFTSTRDGDLDLYVMEAARPRAAVRRITHLPGYDGGAFFSPDCRRIVWRASRPSGEALEEYRALLAEGLVRPSRMEIFVANADGSEPIQVTHNGAANFAPYFLPDNRRVIFASNVADPGGRNFDLYVADPWATGERPALDRVTTSPVFESFPMFSPDGRWLLFASNRNAKHPGDTNLFLAEWMD